MLFSGPAQGLGLRLHQKNKIFLGKKMPHFSLLKDTNFYKIIYFLKVIHFFFISDVQILLLVYKLSCY